MYLKKLEGLSWKKTVVKTARRVKVKSESEEDDFQGVEYLGQLTKTTTEEENTVGEKRRRKNSDKNVSELRKRDSFLQESDSPDYVLKRKRN